MATPEYCAGLDSRDGLLYPWRRTNAIIRCCPPCRRWREDSRIWLLIGSIGVQGAPTDGLTTAAIMIDPMGQIAARYDKIHMFDVDLGAGQGLSRIGHHRTRREGGDQPLRGRLDRACRSATTSASPHLYRALWPGRGGDAGDAGRLHRHDGRGALACAAARPRHRERRLCDRALPVSARWPGGGRVLRPFADRRSLGAGAGRMAGRTKA